MRRSKVEIIKIYFVKNFMLVGWADKPNMLNNIEIYGRVVIVSNKHKVVKVIQVALI